VARADGIVAVAPEPSISLRSRLSAGLLVVPGIVWLLVFLTTRYASAASVLAGIALPVAAVALEYPISVVLFGVGAASAIVYLHWGNIRRLRAGTEHRFRLRRTASA